MLIHAHTETKSCLQKKNREGKRETSTQVHTYTCVILQQIVHKERTFELEFDDLIFIFIIIVVIVIIVIFFR